MQHLVLLAAGLNPNSQRQISIFLLDFCAYVTVNAPKGKHVITANEGNAVGLASGYHLATGKHPMVYLQVC